MKRLFFALVAALSAISAFAYDPQIHDIDIHVNLDAEGTAHITEVWDVVVASGTEWYLVRENLGDISIENLSVTDESGLRFYYEGSWDVDRSISQKAGKCGLHRTSGGYEICWGVGSYGPHTFTVSYDMTNAVKTLNDYDMLHMQFVSDELSSRPGHVKLTLSAPETLNEENSRIWGFGYEGTTAWDEGSVVAESTEQFRSSSSLILLVRFDKGIFTSPSVQEKDFQEVLDRALEGSDFGDEDEDMAWYEVLLGMIMSIGFTWLFFIYPIKKFLQFIGVAKAKNRSRIKDIFGVRRLPKKVDWSRALPFQGGMQETYYVASHIYGDDDNRLSIVPAMMLHLMYEGVIVMNKTADGKKEFHFNEGASHENLSESEIQLVKLLKQAAGPDNILQEKEFGNWASRHSKQVERWVKDMRDEVRMQIVDHGHGSVKNGAYEMIKFTPEGQQAAMQALGFRQYLKDFTLLNERYAPEVVLWGKYLIFAALYGMADRVAKDMKNLAPDAKIGIPSMQVTDMGDIIVFTESMRGYARSAYRIATTPTGGYSGGGSSGGFGGHSSFGGGGGFSGGGHGGGSR